MRKLLLFIITILVSVEGFAQKASQNHLFQQTNTVYTDQTPLFTRSSNAKATSTGDTLVLSNIPTGDSTFVLYREGTNDSNGYLTGTDSSNDQAFAELYNINGADSSINVIGVFAQFGGTVNAASTKTINFNVWDEGAPIVVSATLSYSGFPNDLLDSVTVPITQLGIGTTGDTMKAFLFTTPTGTIQNDFFIGYSINYNFSTLNGDTIGLASSVNGTRTSVAYTTALNTDALGDTSLDTVFNVQNATMQSDNNWYDNYTQNDSIYNNLAIFPIVAVGSATGIKGVKNNFTFFGNYPNPAVNSTDIKFSISAVADVTIQIMDMAGRTLNIINETNLSTGMHIITIKTANMPAGDYLYLVRTSQGAGMASKLTVIK